eukprot:29156-Eustigmatos_ZCMA.PRE.1
MRTRRVSWKRGEKREGRQEGLMPRVTTRLNINKRALTGERHAGDSLERQEAAMRHAACGWPILLPGRELEP